MLSCKRVVGFSDENMFFHWGKYMDDYAVRRLLEAILTEYCCHPASHRWNTGDLAFKVLLHVLAGSETAKLGLGLTQRLIQATWRVDVLRVCGIGLFPARRA